MVVWDYSSVYNALLSARFRGWPYRGSYDRTTTMMLSYFPLGFLRIGMG